MNRGTILAALFLIGLGILFLIFNVLGVGIDQTWPVIFYAIGAVFFLPALLWPGLRAGMSALVIPGTILITLGCIFQYNVLSGDWASWGYAWILLGGGVGLGLAFAGRIGGWGKEVITIGWWMFILSTIVFSIFATLFGGTALRAAAPLALVLFGIWLLVRALRK
jgi:hypothetical protein